MNKSPLARFAMRPRSSSAINVSLVRV